MRACKNCSEEMATAYSEENPFQGLRRCSNEVSLGGALIKNGF